MNTVLYYFSGTGNSLVLAKDLASELGGADIVSIAGALKTGGQGSYETVGVVFPVYMFGLPLIVAEFLKNMKVREGAYVFLAATLGGLPGRAHSLGREILKKRGIELAAGFSVRMPGNYTPLYEAIPQERQEKIFKREKAAAREIAGFVREKRSGDLQEKPFLINLLLYKLLYRGGTRYIPQSGKGFWVTDSCTRCGLCARICPVENIELSDGKPVWLRHCQHCMACLQWCPVEAIQYKKSTVGRKRYHHPGVTADDIIAQRSGK